MAPASASLGGALARLCLAALVAGMEPGGMPTPAAASPAGQGIPVLMYHRVDPQLTAHDPITVSLTVMAATFEAELGLLRANGYQSMTLDALRDALDHHVSLPAHRVVLTFDDGYEDNYTVVFPLLHRYGFVGAFFVVTTSVGTRDHLTPAQIREMAEAGMEIQSHGVHHVDFSRLSLAQARSELVQSRKTIEGWTGHPVMFFAYPAGRYSAALERLLATLGYRGALTERPGFVSPGSPPYLLERVRIDHADTPGWFARRLDLSVR